MYRVIFFLSLFFAICCKAQAQLYYGAYEGNIDDCQLLGFDKRETYDIAMCVDDESLLGCCIVGMRFPVCREAVHAGDYSLWLTRELKLSAGAVAPDILKQSVTPQGDWVEVTFAEPHEVDGPFYAGYSLTVTDLVTEADYSPLIVLPRRGEGGCWLHTSRTYRSFVDYAEQRGFSTTIQLVLEGGSLPQHAITMESFDDVYVQAGRVGMATVNVANHGTQPLASFDYEATAGGCTVSHHVDLPEPVSSQFYGHRTAVDIALPVLEETGTWPVEINVTRVNGQPNADRQPLSAGTLIVMTFVPRRRPLLEEYTGTWCGYCTRGYVGMEHMKALYGDEFVGVAYHNADEMETMPATSFPSVVSNYPAAWMDRAFSTDAYYGSVSMTFGIQRTWLERQKEIPVANIEVDAALSADGKSLKVTSTTMFARDLTDANRYRVAYILTADGYEALQHNYYTPGDAGVLGPDMEMFLTAGEMVRLVFNDVVAASTSKSGIGGSIPAKVEQAVPVKHSHTFRLADAVNTKGRPMFTAGIRPGAVAILVDTKTGEVVNAAKISPSRIAETDGVPAVTLSPDDEAVTYFDLQGRRVAAPVKGTTIVTGRHRKQLLVK